MTSTLQIIIQVDAPAKGVEKLVSYLYDQRHPAMEVAVIHHEPPVDLKAVQAHYPISALTLASGMRPGAAINQAARGSDSTTLVIVSNSRLPRDSQWLYHLQKHFADPKVAAVSGEGWDLNQLSMQQPYYHQDLANFLSGPQHGISLTNLAVRRDVWNTFAFDENMSVCVDRQWAYRVLCEGYHVVLDYDGRMHDIAPLTSEEEFKRYWAMNLSFAQFIQPKEAQASLWSVARARAWQSRNPTELLRAYRTWGILRKLNFWQATPTQAMAARAVFSRAGGKWAF